MDELVSLHPPTAQSVFCSDLRTVPCFTSYMNAPLCWECVSSPSDHLVLLEGNRTSSLDSLLFVSTFLSYTLPNSVINFKSLDTQHLYVINCLSLPLILQIQTSSPHTYSALLWFPDLADSMNKGCWKRKHGSGFDSGVSIWGLAWPPSYLLLKDETRDTPLFSLWISAISAFLILHQILTEIFPLCLVESWCQMEKWEKCA